MILINNLYDRIQIITKNDKKSQYIKNNDLNISTYQRETHL